MNKKDTEKQTEEKIEQEEALQEENSQELKIDENSGESSEESSPEDSKIDELQEQLLRYQAEIQNLRRISQNEVTKARLYGNENLVKDLIPSIDNLFRTLEHQDIEAKTVPAEGISLIVREIISALEKNGISVIDPKGEEFDPKEHEALSVSDDDKEKPNIVLEVFQKGFKFNERVVRPAMVVVNKK